VEDKRMLNMRSGLAALAAGASAVLCLAGTARAAADDLSFKPQSAVSTAVATVRPAVVAIETRFKEPVLKDEYAYWSYLRGARPLYGLWGSGFVYSDPNYVVTTSFLMSDAEYIRVIIEDGRSYKAELVGENEDLDVAVLKVDWGPDMEMPAPSFADSDSLHLGQPIAIVGKALNSVDTYASFGVVSAIRKEVPGADEPTDAFLQFDASYELSFTGAPMVDVAGKVVGMVNKTVQDFSLTNINLAVPANDIISTAERIISGDTSELAFGLEGLPINSGLIETGRAPTSFDWDSNGKAENLDFGMFVTYIVPGSPLELAGLKAGDIVVDLDGQRMKYTYDFTRYKRGLQYGQLVNIDYLTRDDSGKWVRRSTQAQVLLVEDEDEEDASAAPVVQGSGRQPR
jgi:S1-C subfamily serine protease